MTDTNQASEVKHPSLNKSDEDVKLEPMSNQAGEDELKEKLAEIEHERWADWQKWCHKVLREKLNPEGIDCVLEDVLGRWDRQIETQYSELSDEEKASDMEQVDRYWSLVLSFIRTEKLKLLAEVRERVIGEDETRIPADGGPFTNTTDKPNHYITLRNANRADQRAALNKLEAEL